MADKLRARSKMDADKAADLEARCAELQHL